VFSGLYGADALPGSEYGSIATGEMLYEFSGYSRSSCLVAEQRLVADVRQLAPVIESKRNPVRSKVSTTFAAGAPCCACSLSVRKLEG
jgi:hypothetical protein